MEVFKEALNGFMEYFCETKVENVDQILNTLIELQIRHKVGVL